MKYLITGAGGQLSDEWISYCNKQSIEYIALGINQLDITNEDQIKEVIATHKPSVIINCAAYTQVDKAEDEVEFSDSINHKAVELLANIAVAENIKVVHYSTDYVFKGDDRDIETFPEGYPEDHQTNPINIYGQTKLDGELALQQSGADYLILRISWLCGVYGNNFVKTMLKLSENRKELNVVNDQYGSPTFAGNVVDLTHNLLLKNAHGVYHLSSMGIISWFDLASKIFELSEIKIKVNPVSSKEFKTKAKRPAFSKLSTNKVEKLLGVPIIHWEEGLKSLLKEIESS